MRLTKIIITFRTVPSRNGIANDTSGNRLIIIVVLVTSFPLLHVSIVLRYSEDLINFSKDGLYILISSSRNLASNVTF
jgi:hypothetical protein